MKWRGDLTETIGAYERLGLLELRARAVRSTSIEEKIEKSRRWKNLFTVFIFTQ